VISALSKKLGLNAGLVGQVCAVRLRQYFAAIDQASQPSQASQADKAPAVDALKAAAEDNAAADEASEAAADKALADKAPADEAHSDVEATGTCLSSFIC
jgi:hypothetical protein